MYLSLVVLLIFPEVPKSQQDAALRSEFKQDSQLFVVSNDLHP